MYKTLTIMFFFIASLVSAQDIEIMESNSNTYYGFLGSEIKAPIKIKNITNHPVYVFVKRIDSKIGSTQSVNFCWGEECYDKTVDRLAVSKKIEPGEISEYFVSVLQAGLVSGFSSVKYEIYTRGNPHQSVKHELNYIVEDKEKSNILFSSENVLLNEIYPNPVNENAFIDYQINDPETEVKVMIHNVLGTIVGDFKLNPNEKELKIPTSDYNAGVYFYTLYVNGDGLITKKLVIRR